MRTFLLAALLSTAALADERGEDVCRDEGTRVVCTKDGFTRIAQRHMELQTSLRICIAEKATAEGEVGRLRTALESCAGVPSTPTTTCSPPRNPTLQHVGFALGVVGTAMAVMAPFFPNIGPVNQGLLIAGGAVTTGLGYIITF